jgi:hypothetical protein
MLTISKPLCAGQAQTHRQKEFTAKEQNYWLQQGVIAGEWQGRLAGQFFRLAGAVSAEDFARLSQGQHTQTGEQLVRQRASYEYLGCRRQDHQDNGAPSRLGCDIFPRPNRKPAPTTTTTILRA